MRAIPTIVHRAYVVTGLRLDDALSARERRQIGSDECAQAMTDAARRLNRLAVWTENRYGQDFAVECLRAFQRVGAATDR